MPATGALAKRLWTCYIGNMAVLPPPPAFWPPPVLWPTPKLCVWISGDGEVEELSHEAAANHARRTPPLVCHARATARRLGCDRFTAYDLLELFAFARPAQFCLPTPRGLARAFELAVPDNHIDKALLLSRVAELLIDEIAGNRDDRNAEPIARVMNDCGWPWAPLVLEALGVEFDTERRRADPGERA